MKSSSIRLGVDIGGTFTDVVLEKDQALISTKVLTTYTAPEDAIIEGMQQVCAKAGVQPSQIDQIIHGTTLATNALIERRGAKTALITTEGFRDVFEVARTYRFKKGSGMPISIPVIIRRKELRPDSGGAGKTRGGLGQYMEVGAQDGHEFDIQAMFDRGDHPARGRRGGKEGARTTIAQDDGSAMRVKDKQFVAHGRKVVMAFPGGAGYGDPSERPKEQVMRDLALGYITAQTAAQDYGLTAQEIATVDAAVAKGDTI